jgi:hypothetical protein
VFAEQERPLLDAGEDPQPPAAPNNDTFCAVLRGLFHDKGRGMGSGTSVETFGKITSAMMTADIMVGPKIMAHGLEMFLMDGEVESVRPYSHLLLLQMAVP